MSTAAFAAKAANAPLGPFAIERRELGPKDIRIEIEFCGVCHSDLHMVNNDWGFSQYPLVPGHEIVGTIAEVGSEVSGFAVGDKAAVGCLVDSCRHCAQCEAGNEQYCNAFTMTYGSATNDPGGVTYGGYSREIICDQEFVLSISGKLDPAGAAPLLCAGITTWSPLKHWKVGPGQTVGIVGLGGLGHMGVKFAHALGAHVVMITTSPEKGEDAKALGADEVLISKDDDAMAKNAGRFDFILNTIPVRHDLNPYVGLLKIDGVMCIVGAVEQLPEINSAPMVFGRRSIAGSLIGGLKETQEMLDFCAEHGITSDIEIIQMDEINQAYERMQKSDVKYRFVIDMSTLPG
ncbi:NAD(P)-dependent alcohol dehydrogenase [Parvularcula marina]|uniref:NAD(P)-dependent alcohol dehydrogenase n=1 Tax=Parvularcula marina TaxID=2292771 RepID=A0A371R7T7_9PROT|nr:NAD(P)-dependent alcohol dehydrogenase [Parvularcula marina]RFB01488.1 NAD(P)-dependent alcohol dehydrogenase [Parvularcula marina]